MCSTTFQISKKFSDTGLKGNTSNTNTEQDIECVTNVNHEILNINIQCLSNKINLLENFINSYNFSFLTISEHWYQDSDITNIFISHFKVLDHFSRTHHTRGGVSILVKSNLLSECMPINFIKSLSIEMIIEMCAISFKKEYCLINIYRPPSDLQNDMKLFFSQLEKVLTYSLHKFKYVIVSGDFNIDQFCNNLNTKKLFDIFNSFGMTSLVTEYTRIFTTINYTSRTSIDYVITNTPHFLHVSNFDPGLSDHHCQIVKLDLDSLSENDNTSDVKNNFYTFRLINENSIKNFKCELSKIVFDFKANADVNQIFENFLENFLWCFNLAFPKKTVKSCPSLNKTRRIQFSEELNLKRKRLRDLDWLRKRIYDYNVNENYKNLKKEIDRQTIVEKKLSIKILLITLQIKIKQHGH